LILAGPNGSGKTTFAREFLPAEGNCPTFLNADLIAAGSTMPRRSRRYSSMKEARHDKLV